MKNIDMTMANFANEQWETKHGRKKLNQSTMTDIYVERIKRKEAIKETIGCLVFYALLVLLLFLMTIIG